MDDAMERELIMRFTLATFMEAARLYEEGIATPEDIDIAMRAGAGLKEGPFHWADMRGLDRVLEDLKALSSNLGARFSPPVSLTERVHRGQLGVKSGQGYLDYASEV